MPASARRNNNEGGAYGPRNTAESTGRLPPTPTPSTARREARVTKFPEPPAARPNMPAMRRVRLKDHLRPQMSQPIPHTTAPTKRPMLDAKDKKGPLNWNSLITGARMSPPMSCHRRSGRGQTDRVNKTHRPYAVTKSDSGKALQQCVHYSIRSIHTRTSQSQRR